MTTKNKESLIGYDPLAWMNDAGDSPSDVPEPIAVETLSSDASVQDKANIETMAEELIAEPSALENQSDSVVSNEQSDSSAISLDASLNIHNVTQMQEQMINALHANERIEIDASAVNTVDTASMQLLVVLKQEAIRNNKEIIFDFPSDKFIEAAQLLGIAEMLAVDQAAAGFF